MNFDFRSLSNDEEQNVSDSNDGLLKIDVPHWAAEVKIFDNAFRPVPNVGKIEVDSESGNSYVTQTYLPPGVYKVETTLEGETESEWIPVRPNHKTEVPRETWKTLKFTSSAPLEDTYTNKESHHEPAEHLSTNPTWENSPGGNSQLFLFVRTLKPQKYGDAFAEGLQLINQKGELVTDFSEGIKKDPNAGWMGFNANLPAGGYLLRRSRKGVNVRFQVIYLCPDYQTQVFLKAKSYPSLNTMSFNMAEIGRGFRTDDKVALSSEVILNGLRYGIDSQAFFSNVRLEENLESLLLGKFENPWLGILVAHAILILKEQTQTGQNTEFDRYFDLLENKVKPFLENSLPNHPDAQSILLSEETPAEIPFEFPPMLWASFKRIQAYSTIDSRIIPKDSLTDCLLDGLIINSPWIAWNHLTRQPNFAYDFDTVQESISPVGKKHNLNVRKQKQQQPTEIYLKSMTGKFGLSKFVEEDILPDGLQFDSDFPEANSSQMIVQNASIIQTATKAIQDFSESKSFEDMPEMIDIDSSKEINDLLNEIDVKQISQKLSLPLSQTQSGLESLKTQMVNPPAVSLGDEKKDKSSIAVQKSILDYALSELKDTSSSATKKEPSKRFESILKIETLVSKIKIEADRIYATIEKSEEKFTRQTNSFAEKTFKELDKIAKDLLDHANFVLVTNSQGQILDNNEALSLLLTYKQLDKTQYQLQKQQLETALLDISLGTNYVTSLPIGQTGKNWQINKTEIQDKSLFETKLYLNILRYKDSKVISDKNLQKIDSVISNLMLYSSLFAYGSLDKQSEYISKLNEIVASLKTIIRSITK